VPVERTLIYTKEGLLDEFRPTLSEYGPAQAWFEEDGVQKYYTSYCLGFDAMSVRGEGSSLVATASDKSMALIAFQRQLRNLLYGKRRVVWRLPPTLVTESYYDNFDDTERIRYSVVCRAYIE
jgi:hypothetical protein